jgi:SAM-dependent methyltransferase
MESQSALGINANAQQTKTDEANRAFWDELCGTQLAKSLGIKDQSRESLRKYDHWYSEFYPYLDAYIPFAELKGRKVLEVGLGYGTIAQRISEQDADYIGLDIAEGPVRMAKHRFAQSGLKGEATLGSILNPPFSEESFDFIVAIGCLHHTGNLENAIRQVHRLLKDGGTAVVMIYSALSYRQWIGSPYATLKRAVFGKDLAANNYSAGVGARKKYDANSMGKAAPETVFVTAAELASLCRDFKSCEITAQNIGGDGPLRFIDRRLLCRWFGRSLGLDLYCRLGK